MCRSMLEAKSVLAGIALQTLLAWNSVLISSKIWLRLMLGKRLAAFSMSLYNCATPAEAAMHHVLNFGAVSDHFEDSPALLALT